MALKGDLRDFPTTSLFNLVNLARKTGLLVVQSRGRTANVYFKQGKLIRVTIGNQAVDLVSVLRRSGKITPEQALGIRNRARSQTDKELGLLLISNNYCNQRDIVQAVKGSMLEHTYPLFGWHEGSFSFEPGVAPSEDELTISLNLESIILEGTRWIKEWKDLQDDLPSLDISLAFVPKPPTNLKQVQLTVEEWRVLSHINPKNTVREIARACALDEFQIRKIIYRLLQAGLVQVAAHQAKMPAAAAAHAAAAPAVHGDSRPAIPPPPKVNRGLVQKLIHKIRSLGA